MKFIELSTEEGIKILVNTRFIERIQPHSGGCMLVLPGADNYIVVRESFEDVCDRIL